MTTDKRFIITGTFGSGKSTLLHSLRTLGFACIEEPARPILAEQRNIEGEGLPDKNARLFVELMLSRALYNYRLQESAQSPVFFDRGIPDMLAYASHFGFDYAPGRNAAEKYRYNRRVFFAPAWEEIYTQDEERTVSFKLASQFGDDLQAVYERLGYELIILPCLPNAERVEFLLHFL